MTTVGDALQREGAGGVVSEAEHLEGRRHGVDRLHDVQSLAREPSRTEDDQLTHRHP